MAFQLAMSVMFNNDAVRHSDLGVGHEEVGQGHYDTCEFKSPGTEKLLV